MLEPPSPMPRRRPLIALLSASALLTAGCAIVGRDYRAPEGGVPDAWSRSVSQNLGGERGGLEKWWKGFRDPVLDRLIDRARESNPDLRGAYERIVEARAQRGVARSQLFPSLNAGGDYVRRRASESLLVPPGQNPSNLFSAGFDSGWEIDVFGGLRRAVESTEAGVGASEETYRDVLLSLYAEVALNYIEYRTLQRRIELAVRNIDAQSQTVELTNNRLEAGLVPKIDVTQATTNLETSRALVPLLRTQLIAARNRLSTLTGGFPGSLDRTLNRSRPIPTPRRGYSAGLPADLLRGRPDVRAAERELAAQTALIGVAEADLYPRFTLFGDFNLQSVDASDFFDAGSRAWSFGPSFRWQIFSAGRIRNNVRIEESRTAQALAGYESAVLLAVEEVETSMASIAYEWQRTGFLGKAVTAAEETVGLVKSNYAEGLVDFQRVLDAERTKFNTEDEAAVSKGQIAKNYVALYKALGGGSEVEVVPDRPPGERDPGETPDAEDGKP